jgi:hypothetical protein
MLYAGLDLSRKRLDLAGMRRNLFIADEIQAWLDGCELEVVTSSDGGRVICPAGGH